MWFAKLVYLLTDAIFGSIIKGLPGWCRTRNILEAFAVVILWGQLTIASESLASVICLIFLLIIF